MKKLSLMIAALALVLGLSQCKKDEKPAASGEKQHIVLSANNGNDGSKVNVGVSGSVLNLTWETNDVITVSDGASGELHLTGGAGTANATFEGDIELNRAGDIVFSVGSENCMGQTGTIEGLKNIIYLVGTSEYKEDRNYDVTMELQYAVLKLNVSALGTSGELTISDGTSGVASVTNVTTPSEVFVAVPADGSQKNYTIGFGGKTATKEWTLAANTFYTKSGSTTGEAIVIEPDTPTYLPGLFSVSATTQVYFSKGNLQYVKDSGKWQFAANQYDIVETNGQNVGDDYKDADVQTLFGWGDLTPLTTSKTAAYSWTKDWGTKIDDKGTWRTLTGGENGEWNYLLNQRTMTNNGKPRYTKAVNDGITIGGTTTYKGLFIYPDDYDGTEVGADETTDTWDKIDALGIVFLPAAGSREGASVSSVGSSCYYWSSSSYGSAAYSLILFGSSGNVYPGTYGSDRYIGFSVRLVSEKKN